VTRRIGSVTTTSHPGGWRQSIWSPRGEEKVEKTAISVSMAPLESAVADSGFSQSQRPGPVSPLLSPVRHTSTWTACPPRKSRPRTDTDVKSPRPVDGSSWMVGSGARGASGSKWSSTCPARGESTNRVVATIRQGSALVRQSWAPSGVRIRAAIGTSTANPPASSRGTKNSSIWQRSNVRSGVHS
jgi:hypothetical protein